MHIHCALVIHSIYPIYFLVTIRLATSIAKLTSVLSSNFPWTSNNNDNKYCYKEHELTDYASHLVDGNTTNSARKQKVELQEGPLFYITTGIIGSQSKI